MRWRSNKWKVNERELMKLSEGLFAPSLNMKWDWKGTRFDLLKDGEVIWSSIIDYTPSWDYPGAHMFARILKEYINTPVVDLKAKKIEHVSNACHYHEPEMIKNTAKLARIMLAADRRIGKNVLEVWLFVEPERHIRNIIGQRV